MRTIYIITLSFCFICHPLSQELIKNINLSAKGSQINDLQRGRSGVVFTAINTIGHRSLYLVNDTMTMPLNLFDNLSTDQLFWCTKTVGDSTFFFTYDEGIVKLWLVDLPTRSTYMVKEWVSNSGFSGDLGQFTKVGEVYYFLLRIYNHSFDLWETDGTTEGTRFVTSLPGNSFPTNFMELGGKLIYYLRAFEFENDIWSFDGNTTTEIFSNPTRYGFQIIKYKDHIFFPAEGDSLGTELWISDGTLAGTLLLKDIYSGEEGAYPSSFSVFDDMLYFAATDSLHGAELWKSDGSSIGTELAFDIFSGMSNSRPYNFNTTANYLFFTASDSAYGRELWVTDGTDLNTKRLTDITPGPAGTNFSVSTSSDSLLFFTAFDSIAGVELYKSNGSTVGTFLLKDIYAGSGSSQINRLVTFDNRLYFNANDCIHGSELWKSDGTSESTELFFDLNGNEEGSSPRFLSSVLGNKVIFQASEKDTGSEPYITDGTESGTFLLKDLFPGASGSNCRDFIEYGGKIYFLANTTEGSRLIESDGTKEGTLVFSDKLVQNHLHKINDVLLMDAFDVESGTELWIFNGDTLKLLKDILPGPTGSNTLMSGQKSLNGNLFFYANDGVHGYELWKTDGTNMGTTLVKDINVGEGSSDFSYVTVFDSFFLFVGGISPNHEVWRSDGTEGGTHQLKDIYPGTYGSSPRDFTLFNHEIYFAASDHRGRELWRTNGTEEGTVLFKDINMNGSSYPENLTTAYDKLIFSATSNLGAELWSSDGTASGTVLLKDIYDGPRSSYPRDFYQLNNLVLLSAENQVSGRELWKTDGTIDGTQLLVDLYPGINGSYSFELAQINDQVIFNGDNGHIGAELWNLEGLCLFPTNLNLDGVLSTGIYQAEIFLSMKSIIGEGHHVDLKAGNEIELLPDCQVELNAELTIKIEGCQEN